METAAAAPLTLPRRMTWTEIVATWPDQFVVLTEMDGPERSVMIDAALVHAATPVRSEASKEVAQLPIGTTFSVRWTGEVRGPRRWWSRDSLPARI